MKTYNREIMHAVRKRLGLDETDITRDKEIMEMPKCKIFDMVCTWNGLINHGQPIINWIDSIYDIRLK